MEWLVDPATNAKWAYKLSAGGTDWGKWETYVNGDYKNFLLQSQQAFAQVAAMTDQDRKNIIAGGSAATSSLDKNTLTGATGSLATPAAAANPLAWLSSIGGFFGRLSDPNLWLRIGEFVIGAALVVVGLASMVSGTSVGKTAKKVAMTGALI